MAWYKTTPVQRAPKYNVASGTVATFNTNLVAPLKSLTAQIVPIQEGTGDPSPTNPRPISGTSVLNVDQRGKNILNPNSEIVPHSTYGFFPLCPNNTPLTMTLFDNDTSVDISDVSFGFSLSLTENGAQSEISNGFVWSVNSGTITGRTDNVMGGKYCDQFVFYPKTQTTLEKIFQRFNIVVSVGTTTATTYEAYTGSTYPIALGRTVYGGSAEVVGGTGNDTHKLINLIDLTWTLQNGTFYSQPLADAKAITDAQIFNGVSSHFVSVSYNYLYAKVTDNSIAQSSSKRIYIYSSAITTLEQLETAIADAQLAYELATPTDFTFTGQPINSLLGTNNVWTDTGDTEVEYAYMPVGNSGAYFPAGSV